MQATSLSDIAAEVRSTKLRLMQLTNTMQSAVTDYVLHLQRAIQAQNADLKTTAEESNLSITYKSKVLQLQPNVASNMWQIVTESRFQKEFARRYAQYLSLNNDLNNLAAAIIHHFKNNFRTIRTMNNKPFGESREKRLANMLEEAVEATHEEPCPPPAPKPCCNDEINKELKRPLNKKPVKADFFTRLKESLSVIKEDLNSQTNPAAIPASAAPKPAATAKPTTPTATTPKPTAVQQPTAQTTNLMNRFSSAIDALGSIDGKPLRQVLNERGIQWKESDDKSAVVLFIINGTTNAPQPLANISHAVIAKPSEFQEALINIIDFANGDAPGTMRQRAQILKDHEKAAREIAKNFNAQAAQQATPQVAPAKPTTPNTPTVKPATSVKPSASLLKPQQ